MSNRLVCALFLIILSLCTDWRTLIANSNNLNLHYCLQGFIASITTSRPGSILEMHWKNLIRIFTCWTELRYDTNRARCLKHCISIWTSPQQIVDDSLNLARASIVNYSLALDTVQYLEKEVHYLPWLAAYNNLGFIVDRFTTKDSNLIKVSWVRVEWGSFLRQLVDIIQYYLRTYEYYHILFIES